MIVRCRLRGDDHSLLIDLLYLHVSSPNSPESRNRYSRISAAKYLCIAEIISTEALVEVCVPSEMTGQAFVGHKPPNC